MIDKLLDLFDKDSQYKTFHFDGQTVVLEDYAKISPENKDRLKSLIKDNKILIGPWYVMPDEFLVSGESLIRNLMLGHKVSKEWGAEAWKYGYICDIFGHIAQMPQIFNGFGIKYSILGRGTIENDPTFFKWQSPDGSECINFRLEPDDGYGSFCRKVYSGIEDKTTANPVIIERIKKHIDSEIERSEYPVVIIMDGLDHMDASVNTTDYINAIAKLYPNARVHHADLRMQGEMMEKYDNLPVKKGELNKTSQFKHGYLHLITNTLSSYYPVKKANDICQNLLEKEAEPFCALSKIKGSELNRNFLNLAYEYLIKNHPHDSICGCSIDRVHKDMEYRFAQSESLCKEIISDYIYSDKKADDKEAIEKGEFENIITFYNPLPFDVDKTITVDLPFKMNYPNTYSEPFNYESINSFKIYDYDENEIPYQVLKIQKDYTLRYHGGNVGHHLDLHTVTLRVKIPACGKSEYKLVPCNTPVRYLEKLKSGSNYAENEFVRLDITNDGTLNITNKANGKKYSNLCYFADDGEIGDGWYHANPVCDRLVYSNGSPCAIEKIENGPSRCVFKITKKLEVPEELADFRNGKSRSENTVELKLVSYVGLSEESPFIDVKLSYDNIAKDHRLRMFVPTGIQSDTYFSGQAFCCVERKVGIDYSTQNWRETDQYEKSTNGIAGKRDSENDGIALVFANGIHECAAFDDEDGSLAFTLSRSFFKTHNTSGETRCQINMPLEYNFNIAVLDSKTEYCDLVKQQDVLATQINSTFTYTGVGKNINAPQSLLSVSGDVNTSVIKCSEDNNGIVVRLFNPSDDIKTAKISLCRDILKAELVNLNEEFIRETMSDKNNVELKISPWKIETLKIYF